MTSRRIARIVLFILCISSAVCAMDLENNTIPENYNYCHQQNLNEEEIFKNEQYAVDNIRQHGIADFSSTGDDLKPIRAEFISSQLINSKDLPVRGLQIRGALILGNLDISFYKIRHSISFENCEFSCGINLSNAETEDIYIRQCNVLPTVMADGTPIGSITADGLQVNGDLVVERCLISDTVRLIDGNISGDLTLIGNSITAYEYTQTSNNMALGFLTQSVRIDPENKRKIANNGAIEASSLFVGSRAFFEDNKIYDGRVYLNRIHVPNGVLSLMNLIHDDDMNSGIILESAKADEIFLGGLQTNGLLSLQQASCRIYFDEPRGGIQDEEQLYPGVSEGMLDLYGFMYKNIAGERATDEVLRLEWLSLQNTQDHFYRQPYEQYASFLEENGYFSKANRVRKTAVELSLKSDGVSVLEYIYGLVCYGYCFWRVVLFYFALVLWGAFLAHIGIRNKKFVHVDGDNPKREKNFNPLYYSIDKSLRYVNLRVVDNWTIEGVSRTDFLFKFYFVFHEIIGWIFTIGLAGYLVAILNR